MASWPGMEGRGLLFPSFSSSVSPHLIDHVHGPLFCGVFLDKWRANDTLCLNHLSSECVLLNASVRACVCVYSKESCDARDTAKPS